MSHFTVLVIGEDYEKLLAPYHEYECTGRDDEYVIDVDLTDEVIQDWEEDNRTTVWVEDATGTPYSPSDKRFYHIATEEEITKYGLNGSMGFSNGVSYFRDWADDDPDHNNDRIIYVKNEGMPVGFTEKEVSYKDSGHYPNLADFADNYHGAFERDGRYYRHTNPNAKWDWYQVGGRWSGFFKLKEGAAGLKGDKSFMGGGRSEDGVDQLRIGDIDFEGMKAEARIAAANDWDKAAALVAGYPQPESWDSLRKQYSDDIPFAREIYHEQPAVQALREGDTAHDFFGFDIQALYGENAREKYIASRECSYITFAVCTAEGWFEKGKMGWWACVTDEKLEYDWAAKYTELLDGLPEDTIVTVVDCHI